MTILRNFCLFLHLDHGHHMILLTSVNIRFDRLSDVDVEFESIAKCHFDSSKEPIQNQNNARTSASAF